MKFGKLDFADLREHTDLVPTVVSNSAVENNLTNIFVSAIDTSLADTAAFCDAYNIGMEVSANCVIVEARRGDKTWYAACVVLATTRADINGVIRKHLDARKISFAPMDVAVKLTSMEYGGITPVGLPADWPIIIDSRVIATDKIIIGSGSRSSKLLIPGELLETLPHAVVLDIVKPDAI